MVRLAEKFGFAKDDELNRKNRMVIFAILTVLKRIGDQSKNICDQTVFAVRGIAKVAKVYKVLFLDQQGSGVGQLAAAIGRHNFSENVEFTVATPGGSDGVSAALADFLDEAGLEDEDLETEQLEGLEHDIDHFTVVVSVNGDYSDYIEKMPFHTSALNWPIETDSDLTTRYRDLRNRITDLVELVVGTESEQD